MLAPSTVLHRKALADVVLSDGVLEISALGTTNAMEGLRLRTSPQSPGGMGHDRAQPQDGAHDGGIAGRGRGSRRVHLLYERDDGTNRPGSGFPAPGGGCRALESRRELRRGSL